MIGFNLTSIYPVNLNSHLRQRIQENQKRSDMQYEELTRKIIGCAMKVHSTLGCGFQEVIYQRAMAIEMEKQGLKFARELEMSIFYEGVNIGTRRVDFFVEDKIMTELKAVAHLDDTNLNQSINYLEAYNLPVGLLLNFGRKKLEFKRSYNTKHPDNAGYVKKKE